MSDPFRLDGKTVLVTGGTRGIGRAISLRLAEAGARVVANFARNEAAALTLLSDAVGRGLDLDLLRADLTLQKGLDALYERLAGEHSVVSVVHCAATGVHRSFEQLTLRHLDWTMALNARALFDIVQRLLPLMGDGSAVVALSSAGAVRAVPAYAAVGMSKGALEALARHLAVELAPRGIRVNVLSPGSVRTDAWDAFPDKDERLAQALRRTPAGRLVSAEQVAAVAQFLCSPAASGLVGQTIVVDGGARVLE